MTSVEKPAAELAPNAASARSASGSAAATSVLPIIEQLTAQVEALLSSLRQRPAQEARLLAQVDTLRLDHSSLAAGLAELQHRVAELSRQHEVVSPQQLIAAGASPAGMATTGSQEEPFVVTIGSIKTEVEVRRLREAIEHLPSVTAVESSRLDAGSVRFTVRLRETWPRSSFTRQMSWLEGLRLSLIFTGPDGMRADLLASDSGGGPDKQQPSSWLRLFPRLPFRHKREWEGAGG